MLLPYSAVNLMRRKDLWCKFRFWRLVWIGRGKGLPHFKTLALYRSRRERPRGFAVVLYRFLSFLIIENS